MRPLKLIPTILEHRLGRRAATNVAQAHEKDFGRPSLRALPRASHGQSWRRTALRPLCTVYHPLHQLLNTACCCELEF